MKLLNLFSVMNLYRISRILYKKKYYKISKLVDYFNRRINKSVVYGVTDIGENTEFGYGGISVVIHKNAVIGKKCIIGQCVTIGRVYGQEKGIPIIEDNVYIGAGARIIGGIVVGNNSIIAPNSVVNKNVEPCSVVAGVPAKLLAKINFKNYTEKYKFYGIEKYVNEE